MKAKLHYTGMTVYYFDYEQHDWLRTNISAFPAIITNVNTDRTVDLYVFRESQQIQYGVSHGRILHQWCFPPEYDWALSKKAGMMEGTE